MTGTRKLQAVKLWKELEESTEVEAVIRRYVNKSGYGGKRTLERYAQADRGFREGLAADDIGRRTAWSTEYVERLRAWWLKDMAQTTGLGTVLDLQFDPSNAEYLGVKTLDGKPRQVACVRCEVRQARARGVLAKFCSPGTRRLAHWDRST